METALLQLHRSKTDQESEGVVVYIGKQAADAINAIRPAEELPDPVTPLFGISPRQIGRRVQAAAQAAGLGEGFHRTQRPRWHGPRPGRHRGLSCRR